MKDIPSALKMCVLSECLTSTEILSHLNDRPSAKQPRTSVNNLRVDTTQKELQSQQTWKKCDCISNFLHIAPKEKDCFRHDTYCATPL